MLPGIWEVDNGHPPDIIMHSPSIGTTLFKYNNDRICKYLNNDFKFKFDKKHPMPVNFFKERCVLITNYREEIETLKYFFNPMFFHAIEDKNGKLYFLNVRETKKIELLITDY